MLAHLRRSFFLEHLPSNEVANASSKKTPPVVSGAFLELLTGFEPVPRPYQSSSLLSKTSKPRIITTERTLNLVSIKISCAN